MTDEKLMNNKKTHKNNHKVHLSHWSHIIYVLMENTYSHSMSLASILAFRLEQPHIKVNETTSL